MRFTGASPRWLLGVGQRFPHATVVRLEDNYRSSPQVLELANRLVPWLGGAEKVLRPTRPDGPEPAPGRSRRPRPRTCGSRPRSKRLAGAGTPLEEAAVLGRTNARLAVSRRSSTSGPPFPGLVAAPARRRTAAAAGYWSGSRCGGRCRPGSGRLAEEAGLLYTLPDKLGERGPPARPTSPGSSGSLLSSMTVSSRARGSSSSYGCASIRAATARVACTWSPITAPRGSSSTPSSCRDSTTRSSLSSLAHRRGTG